MPFPLPSALPSTIGGFARDVVYPLLAHSQLSVRETAIQCLGTVLTRSTPHQATLQTLSDAIDFLNLRLPMTSARSRAPTPVHAAPPPLAADDAAGARHRDDGTSPVRNAAAAVPSSSPPQLLPAFPAEGVLGLLVVVVRVLPCAVIARSWPSLMTTLKHYLAHGASTVRQITSKVVLQLVCTACMDHGDSGVKLVRRACLACRPRGSAVCRAVSWWARECAVVRLYGRTCVCVCVGMRARTCVRACLCLCAYGVRTRVVVCACVWMCVGV